MSTNAIFGVRVDPCCTVRTDKGKHVLLGLSQARNLANKINAARARGVDDEKTAEALHLGDAKQITNILRGVTKRENYQELVTALERADEA